ncbi:MAG: A/G-specific adenine glycosylase [Verrucomicrobiota bacterium]|nr:A/G-specific adenine glycosylase [Verrucomicrobiota bacterium]
MASTLPQEAPEIRAKLLNWFANNARVLPWRTGRTLYSIVVTEFMLQQTQVSTALPYYDNWMRLWPDFASLASATEEAVLKAWEGLGYYNRARHLHQLAKEIAALPAPPQTAEAWQLFKGIGAYTAAAIASQAFHEPVAVVDGNVIRILTRLTADETTFKDNAQAVKALTPLAQSLVDQVQPGVFNEALMELGATLCTRRKPHCLFCPLHQWCISGRRGDAESFPDFLRKEIHEISLNRIVVIRDGELLLHRTPRKSRRLANLSELPRAEELAIDLPDSAILFRKKRSITNSRITETVYRIPPSPAIMERAKANTDLFWIGIDQIDAIALSGPHRKWVRQILKELRKAG